MHQNRSIPGKNDGAPIEWKVNFPSQMISNVDGGDIAKEK